LNLGFFFQENFSLVGGVKLRAGDDLACFFVAAAFFEPDARKSLSSKRFQKKPRALQNDIVKRMIYVLAAHLIANRILNKATRE